MTFATSKNEQMTQAIALKVAAFASMLGSGYIITKVYKKLKNEGHKVSSIYQRILLGLSISDFIGSFAVFFATWAIPRDSVYHEFTYGEIGNRATCSAQGFLIQLGYSSAIIYNANLTFYFLACVKYGWSKRQLLKMERHLHLFAVVCSLSTALAALAADAYNPIVGWFCWIESYPMFCLDDENVECIRGKQFKLLQLLFMYIPLVVWLGMVATCTAQLYLAVRNQERRRLSYAMTWQNNVQQGSRRQLKYSKETRTVLFLAGWYVVVFFVTWVPLLVKSIICKFGRNSCDSYPFVLRLASHVIVVMQGFLNALVYTRFRPLYLALKNIRSVMSSGKEYAKRRRSSLFGDPAALLNELGDLGFDYDSSSEKGAVDVVEAIDKPIDGDVEANVDKVCEVITSKTGRSSETIDACVDIMP